jgi:hypothetical protein
MKKLAPYLRELVVPVVGLVAFALLLTLLR